MDYRKIGETVYLRMDKGDEIIGRILEVCKKEAANAIRTIIGYGDQYQRICGCMY